MEHHTTGQISPHIEPVISNGTKNAAHNKVGGNVKLSTLTIEVRFGRQRREFGGIITVNSVNYYSEFGGIITVLC
jgi:hypothetical protein